MSQFYALMPDNTVKHIPLKEEIITEILKSATPFPKCYLHKEKWTFDS